MVAHSKRNASAGQKHSYTYRKGGPERWRGPLLAALNEGHRLTKACGIAQVSLPTVRKYRDQDPTLDAAIRQALGSLDGRPGRARDNSWFAQFLAELEQTGAVRASAEAVGIHYTTVEGRRGDDPEFAKAVDAVLAAREERRTVMWREVGKQVAAKMAAGLHFDEAAQAVGCSHNTLENRRRRDPVLDELLTQAAEHGRRARHQQWVSAWQDTVLVHVAAGDTVKSAAKAAGIDYVRVYEERRADPEFEARFLEAWAAAGHGLNASARRMLHDRLRKGYALHEAAAAAGVTMDEVNEARAADPDLDAKIRDNLDNHPARQAARWRKGARDEAARRGHTIMENRRRIEIADAVVRPVWERVLTAIRSGVHINDAAAQHNITTNSLYRYAGRHHRRRYALDNALRVGRDPNINHGTDHSYRAHKCRCPDCKAEHDRWR